MLSLLIAALATKGQDPAAMQMFLTEPGGKPPRLAIWVKNQPLDPPKLSPKLFGDPAQRWQFDWVASSFGPDEFAPKDPKTGQPQARLRFRVFSQLKSDSTTLVARQAIRMWDILTSRYRAGHSEPINQGIVDYYLCFGGEPGGEQLRGEEIVNNRPVTVNTIYIYDIKSFNKPVEMAREVAHEYGHAVLPPVGGYNAPEYWANGFLGEKLFLRRLREQFAKKPFFEADDVMGASETQVDLWVKQNVDPLVTQAASRPPSSVMLGDRGKVGMDAYIGLVLYADTIFPSSIITRSMLLMGSQDAKDYPDSLLRATQEAPRITLSIPDYLKGKPIWIPLGNGKVGQAQVLKKSGDWVQIQPQAGAVVITTAKG
jgi:hypothetical protein